MIFRDTGDQLQDTRNRSIKYAGTLYNIKIQNLENKLFNTRKIIKIYVLFKTFKFKTNEMNLKLKSEFSFNFVEDYYYSGITILQSTAKFFEH